MPFLCANANTLFTVSYADLNVFVQLNLYIFLQKCPYFNDKTRLFRT